MLAVTLAEPMLSLGASGRLPRELPAGHNHCAQHERQEILILAGVHEMGVVKGERYQNEGDTRCRA
jgi:hypothetical protein